MDKPLKKLFLLRHAKSSWDDPMLEDFERPLSVRGRNAAPLMAKYMKEQGYMPDYVLCSTARRTRETLSGLLTFFDHEFDVAFSGSIYQESGRDYLKILKECPPCDELLLIGHNFAMQETALVLAGTQAPGNMKSKFPTAALAVFECTIQTWQELDGEKARLVDYQFPKGLS